MSIRTTKTSVLLRELQRRKATLKAERDYLAGRLKKIEAELIDLGVDELATRVASTPAKDSATTKTTAPAKRKHVTPRNAAYTRLQQILKDAKKPLTAPEAERLLRKSVPVLGKEYASKALSRLYAIGHVGRTGRQGHYKYWWKNKG